MEIVFWECQFRKQQQQKKSLKLLITSCKNTLTRHILEEYSLPSSGAKEHATTKKPD